MSASQTGGWENAVVDHIRAVCQTLIQRLDGSNQPENNDALKPLFPTSGSTYSFHVWPEHPLYDEVCGQLDRLRSELSDLRTRVADAATKTPDFGHTVTEVNVYLGQSGRLRKESL
jgi:hypothetical protein